MQQLSDRINRLSESQTIAMSRMSRELAEKGHDVISLSLGEPDFDTPDFIKEAAKKAIDNNFTKYPPVPGYRSLQEAICKKLERDNGLSFSTNQIVVSTGAKQSLANIMLSLLNPGDEVLLPAPYWVSYLEMVKMAEATPVILPTTIDTGFKVTPEQLEAAITPKTRMFLYSSPCNPSGAAYQREELEPIAEILGRNERLIAVSDEIYEHIRFVGKHVSLGEFDAIKDRVVTVNGVSKAFAMTGWRIGYMAGPQWIAKACTKMQGQFTSGASTVSQKATEAALMADPAVTRPMRDTFMKRRDLVLGWLNEIEGVRTTVPEGAFYLFPDVSHFFGKSVDGKVINNANDLCMYLLSECHVAMVPGEAFGSPDCIRLSYATSEERLKTAIDRVKTALSRLS